jgi:hypothetical protein
MPLPTIHETMKAAQAKHGPRLPELGGVYPLAPFAFGLAPPALKTASAEYAKALDNLAAARARVTDANAAVTDAEWADREAARRAAKTGKLAVEKVPSARAALASAERLVAGYEWEAREKLAAYVASLNEHGGKVVDKIEHRLRTLDGEAKALVAQLEGAMLRRTELVNLRRELAHPVGGRHPQFNCREQRRLPRNVEGALAELRQNGQVR